MLMPPAPQWSPSLLSRHFDQPNNKAAAVRDCSDLKKWHILMVAAIHGLPLWNGLGKIIYCLIRPK
jgi:hypothetical protein